MTSPDDLDALSRLLDGDLPPDQRAALEQRLATEPALARAWSTLHATVAALEGLPPTLPVPPDLPAALPASARAPSPRALPSPARPRDPRLPWLVATLAAAAAFALALRPPAPSTLALAADGATLDGPLDLHLADGTAISLRGRAHLSLTPCADCPPEAAMLAHPALPSSLAGAAAGAALTMLVYEGRATVAPAGGGPATTVEAGESHTLAPAAPAAPPPAAPPARATAAGDLAAEVQTLREENERLRLENALVRGSLATHQGQPLAWPEDLPAALQPAAFTDRVQAALAATEGLELLEVDCSEYPCIAVLRSERVEPGWEQQAQAVPEAIAEELGEGYGVLAMGRGEDDGERALMLLGFAVVPEGEQAREQSTRIGYRAEEAMIAAADALREADEASP